MNQTLLDQIVLHIFSNFAVVPSNFVNFNATKSLRSKEFLLNESLSFETEDGEQINNKIWGCQLIIEGNTLNVLLGNCAIDKNNPEFALIVSIKDAPTYGMYLSEGHSVLAYSLDGKSWLQATTYLQATFLASMEQIRELGMKWSRCENFAETLEMLKSFIDFNESISNDEGAEDAG